MLFLIQHQRESKEQWWISYENVLLMSSGCKGRTLPMADSIPQQRERLDHGLERYESFRNSGLYHNQTGFVHKKQCVIIRAQSLSMYYTHFCVFCYTAIPDGCSGKYQVSDMQILHQALFKQTISAFNIQRLFKC